MGNTIRELLRAGKPMFGTQARFGSPAIAELLSTAGFDWISIDCEHAPQTPVGVQSQVQAIAAGGAAPVVRLPSHDPSLIQLYTDMGAAGLMVPFVNSAAEAKAIVQGLLYPPRGRRGFGPARAANFGMNSHYFEEANDQILFIPLIETAQAVRNIDEIFAVDGVDTCMVGPADLSISLGEPLNITHPKVQEAIASVASAARRAGKSAGMGVYGDWTNPAVVKGQIEAGFSLLLIGGDEWMLSAACKSISLGLKSIRR